MATLNFTAQQPNFKMPELLLHGNIPKPLHQLTPRSILGQEWWDIEREAAYKENNYCCWACGVHKSHAKYHPWLEAHEMYATDWKRGSAEYIGACALCHSCHNFIHRGRLRILLDTGQITGRKYDDIMEHGESLVNTRKMHVPKKVQQKWSKWHLVINGEKHYSLFRDLRHWKKHFGN